MSKIALNLRVLMAAVLIGLPLAALAQVQITARVDQEVISQDDTLELTVTVAGSGLSIGSEPKLPALSGFRILGTATQQSISLVNGSMQSSMNYLYELQPTRTGQLTIPAIKLNARGQTYETDPITVTVLAGSARPPVHGPSGPFGPSFTPGTFEEPGSSADVKHTVDHKTAYVGQQITYTFSFLQSERLYGDVHYSPADTPGFVAEELPNPPQATQTIEGRIYSVQRRMKALFATSPGKHTIGQAGVTAVLDPVLGNEELIAKPITIEVLPLPAAGQPANFSGAVGSFTVRLRLDRPVVRAGETVSCVIEVRGNGNIRSLNPPQLSVPEWVRLYRKPEERSVRPGGGGGGPTVIGGVAGFSYLLLPRQAGNLRVGPVTYNYFDPVSRSYRTATSESADLTVTPGSGAIAPVAPTDNLRPIKINLGRPVGRPITSSLIYWIVIALPLIALVWTAWGRWQEARVLAAPGQARAGRALTLAQKRFDAAEQALSEGRQDAFYAGLHEALLDYIADRTSAPPSGLTADVGYDLLLEHGADAELAALARTLIDRTAAGRFAPGAADIHRSQQLVNECRQTLTALQRQVRPDA